MFKHRDKVIGSFIALVVIALLVFVGPAEAVLVSLTQPNDANKGSDTSFSITVEVRDPDILPIQYTDLLIIGPSGFSKTCRINNDGTDDCSDVDITISKSSISIVNGAQYGYDQNLGYGYGLGTGYGYSSTSTGTITYDVIYHTPSTLTDGIYSAKADVYAQGSSSSHTFSSSSKSFTISTFTTTSGGGGGGGGAATGLPGLIVPTPVPVPTPATPTTPTGGEEITTPPAGAEVPPVTGFAVLTNAITNNPGISLLVLLLIAGIIVGVYFYFKKR